MINRLLGRIGRRFWVHRIDRVLARAKEHGEIDSWLWHSLDHALKYGAKLERRPPGKRRR